jgi:chemotaxis protein CheZ
MLEARRGPEGGLGPGTGGELASRLSLLRERHRDATTPEAVADVVETVLATMHGDLSQTEATLLSEVEQIGRTIAAAKQEIASLQVEDINGSFIPSATDELDAIVEATARATNEILDACETFETISSELGGEASDRIQGATTRIYEACSFQDITGQRITKVVSTLKSIEERIAAIVDTFAERVPGEARVAPKPGPEGEAALLNGPQLPGNGVDQAEIDRLLASFD